MAFLRRPALILRSAAAANRMMSGGGVNPPLLIMGIDSDEDSDPGAIYRSWSITENVGCTFYDNKRKRGENFMSYWDATARGLETVGSSQGWLAYKSQQRDMFLVDPTRYRCRHLPPLDAETTSQVYNVVLDSSATKAFMISGPGKTLSFCWAGGSRSWTRLSAGHGGYESMVYCMTRERLMCLTCSSKIEAWDVGCQFPRLDYVMELRGSNTNTSSIRCAYPRDDHMGSNTDTSSNRCVYPYIVSRGGGGGGDGRLFVVRRRKEERGTRFVVQRVDGEGELVEMKESLEGMSIFVGVNEAVGMMVKDGHALPGGGGLRPNCIYHTFDRRIDCGLRAGIFDYQEGKEDPPNVFLDDDIEEHEYLVLDPVWFIPHYSG